MVTQLKTDGDGSAYRLMVVDDSVDILSNMELILKNEFALYLAASGKEALSQLEFFKPDIVLLNTEMPQMDGFETCRRLRSDFKHMKVFVLFLSPHSNAEERLWAFEAGGDDYIIKPYPYLELKTKLATFIQVKKEREQRISLELAFQKHSSQLEVSCRNTKQELELTRKRLKYELDYRSELEERLCQTEENLRIIINQSRDAIFIVQDGMFQLINPQVVQMFGYSYSQLMSNPFTMAVHPDDQVKIIERHQKRLSGEAVIRRYSFRILTRQKVTRWVELREASTISWNGKPATLAFLSDIDGQKKTEDARIQADKMVSLSGLAAGIAHEINNPLAGIMQSAQNIIRRIDPAMGSNKKAADDHSLDLEVVHAYLEERNILSMLQGILTAGERASHIIQNLQNFVAKNDSQMRKTDLNVLIRESIRLMEKDKALKDRYNTDRIDLKTDLDSSLPEVPCVASEIRNVLINILVNAIQSVHANRLMRRPRIIIRSRTETGRVRLEIEDNGSGIDGMTQRRIFEPFFTTRSVGEGTGIGLSVSYMAITQNHDGEMEVESHPDWGTRFIIRLPEQRPGFH